MNKDDRVKRWMAYLDGQLTASEVLDFEQGLTASERARLDKEVRLESALCERLAGDLRCPAALWVRVSERMKSPAPPRRLIYWLPHVTAVLAATAAIVIGAPFYSDMIEGAGQVPSSVVAIEEPTREEFVRGLEATASFAAAEAYLSENNINLRFVHQSAPDVTHHHQIEYLGIRRGKCPEGTLYELRFWCCGKPAKLLVAKLGTDGARILRHASRCGEARESRVADQYVTAVVCGHDTPELLNLLQPIRGKFT